mmetsp:Transcript_40961/g.56959  ORF Transcript_40961/g.56959 Transcript_40961/m.56959 type:complete len:80 (-) Transcript_40961:888-1127(-)
MLGAVGGSRPSSSTILSSSRLLNVFNVFKTGLSLNKFLRTVTSLGGPPDLVGIVNFNAQFTKRTNDVDFDAQPTKQPTT